MKEQLTVDQPLDRLWPNLRLHDRLPGGARTGAWGADIGGVPVVVRRSTRPQAARSWEWTLLNHLAVVEIRNAWRLAVQTSPLSVVHGDAGSRNALIDKSGRCVLIDWDESRVDSGIFDTPSGAREERAALAWEIATCWTAEPAHARHLARQFVEML